MRWQMTIAVWALVVGTMLAPGRAQSVSDLMEKAIYQEKTAGDLDAAIKIYQSIIEQEKASRSAIAQAYCRLGMCLAKKGDKDKAAEAFQAVVDNYSDQKALLSVAQKELVKLGVNGAPPAKVERRQMEKKIADFPKEVDLSTPESACAAFVRALAAFDPKQTGELSWVASKPQEWQRIEAEKKSDPEGIKVFSQALLDGRILEVLEYGPDFAQVTVLIQGPPGVVRNPYSARSLGKIEGQWKNLGEDRLASLEAARESFDAKKDNLRAAFEQTKRVRGVGTQPAYAAFKGNPLALLDEETRSQIQHFEQSFSSFFQADGRYKAASNAQKAAMIEKWMLDAKSKEFDARTRAIAALGNVKAKEAVHVLLDIVDEPMGNHRPKWLAIRSLGKIGDPTAVPALIEFVDYGNVNTKVYARLALVELTGVYFGEDKAKWQQWWKQRGTSVSDDDKKEAGALAMKGWKAWNDGQHVEAEKLFQQSVARNPSAAHSWNGLGWAQFNQNRPKAARVSFEKAVELDPKHSGALNGLGFVAKAEGNTDEAIAQWKKAIQASPDVVAPISGLAKTYLELKQYDQSAKYYEMLLKVEPDNAEAKAGLEKAKAAGK